jgi:hypothetical protein
MYKRSLASTHVLLSQRANCCPPLPQETTRRELRSLDTNLVLPVPSSCL